MYSVCCATTYGIGGATLTPGSGLGLLVAVVWGRPTQCGEKRLHKRGSAISIPSNQCVFPVPIRDIRERGNEENTYDGKTNHREVGGRHEFSFLVKEWNVGKQQRGTEKSRAWTTAAAKKDNAMMTGAWMKHNRVDVADSLVGFVALCKGLHRPESSGCMKWAAMAAVFIESPGLDEDKGLEKGE